MHVHCCQMAVCWCIQILTLQTHFSDVLSAMNRGTLFLFRGMEQSKSRIQVVCSVGFISSQCLLLIKFENLKEKKKNLHFYTLIQQIRETGERGDEWLTMAFNSNPFRGENPYLSFFSPCCRSTDDGIADSVTVS